MATMILDESKQVALTAVKQNGWALINLPPRYKHDPEIVISAITQAAFVLQVVPKELRHTKHIVLTAVQTSGQVLNHVPAEFKNDKEVVLVAIQQCSSALEFASEELKDDRDVVLAAVKEDSRMLRFASFSIRNDLAFVIKALKVVRRSNNESLNSGVKINADDGIDSVRRTKNFIHLKEVMMQILKTKKKEGSSSALHSVAKLGLGWDCGMKDLVKEYPDDLYKQDDYDDGDGEELTSSSATKGLYPFMLISSSSHSDLNTVYLMTRMSCQLL